MCIDGALQCFTDKKNVKVFRKDGELTVAGVKLYDKLERCLKQLMYAGIKDMTSINVDNIMREVDSIIDGDG